MNDLDLNILKNFTVLTLKYLAEDAEYSVTGLWQNLENARKIRRRLDEMIPLINSIIDC